MEEPIRKKNAHVTLVKASDGGECGKHTLADMFDLDPMTDPSYFWRTRDGDKNRDHVAKHCFGCGKIF